MLLLLLPLFRLSFFFFEYYEKNMYINIVIYIQQTQQQQQKIQKNLMAKQFRGKSIFVNPSFFF